jgi:hypothetical protein
MLISLEVMHKIFKASWGTLMKKLPVTLENYYPKDSIKVHLNKESSFIYVKGTEPFMVVAHLDTVHHKLCNEINYKFYKDKNKGSIITTLSSPQGIGGDDRCGVILILSLLKSTSFRPSIVFTCGEEIGGHGAREFTNIVKDIEANFILEFDRKGDVDVVRYQDDSLELTKALEAFGFVASFGSFSDISIIAPHYGISAVNLSSGYYNAHTTSEYVVIEHMESILDKTIKFLESDKAKIKYEYKKQVSSYSSYSRRSWYSNYTDRYTSASSRYVQPSLFNSNQYRCNICEDAIDKKDIVDTSDGSHVCESCAKYLERERVYIRCSCCNNLTYPEDVVGNACYFCGASFNNDKENN